MRIRVAAAVAVLAVAGLGGCSSATGPTLRLVGSGNYGATFGYRKPDQPIVWTAGPLCTDGGPVRITSVRADGPTGGMRVVDWGVRVQSADLPDPTEPSSIGMVGDLPGFSHAPFNVSCPSKTRTALFDVSVEFDARAKKASMTGVVLTYGNGRTVRDRFDVTECTGHCPINARG